MLIGLLFWGLSLCCWIFALKFGRPASLWAFLLFLANIAGTPTASASIAFWDRANLQLLLVDFTYCLGLTILALRTRIYWPIWSAGMALLATLSHFAPMLYPGADPKVYRAFEAIWMIPILVTMTIGIQLDRRLARSANGKGREAVTGAGQGA